MTNRLEVSDFNTTDIAEMQRLIDIKPKLIDKYVQQWIDSEINVLPFDSYNKKIVLGIAQRVGFVASNFPKDNWMGSVIIIKY